MGWLLSEVVLLCVSAVNQSTPAMSKELENRFDKIHPMHLHTSVYGVYKHIYLSMSTYICPQLYVSFLHRQTQR